jgi:hypothetical protein
MRRPLFDLGTIGMVRTIAIAASATLIANAAGQENHSSSSPDSSSPNMAPAPATPAQRPTARARSSSGKTLVMIESVVGITSAAPTPIPARSAIRTLGLLTKIAAAEAAPNTNSPVSRIPLRP